MTDREQELAEKTSDILGKDTQYMNLVDIIEELVGVIESKKRPRTHAPEWFTKEYYLDLKDKGVTDKHIYENLLFVSLGTFWIYKKELGLIGVRNRQGGNNRKIDYKQAYELHNQGITLQSLAKRYGVRPKSVGRAIRDYRRRIENGIPNR